MRIAGVAGGMARSNAARDPRRTATTSAALMIGLALVSTALVVGESVKATVGSSFERSAKADYFVTDELEDVEFPASVVSDLREADVVDAVAGFSHFEARVDGAVSDVVALDFDDHGRRVRPRCPVGWLRHQSSPTRWWCRSTRRRRSAPASAMRSPSRPPTAPSVDATVVGLFDDQALLTEDYLFDIGVLASLGQPERRRVGRRLGCRRCRPGRRGRDRSPASPTSTRTPITETADEFRQRIEGMVDAILAMVNVLTTLAVVIALIGIANTMALSVFERTRELGLVRAVGMSRRQLRRMVRYEAALVATFGATLGVGLGLLFGAGVVAALPESFAASVSIPVTPIVVVVLVAAVAGVAAAVLPARRAGRLDVLEAIAT